MTDDDLFDAISAATRLVVAGELRRLAQELISEQSAHAFWVALTRRADDLDPGTAPTL